MSKKGATDKLQEKLAEHEMKGVAKKAPKKGMQIGRKKKQPVVVE